MNLYCIIQDFIIKTEPNVLILCVNLALVFLPFRNGNFKILHKK